LLENGKKPPHDFAHAEQRQRSGKISFRPSYGYDFRLADEFKILISAQ
jgi:hypothetical protein